LKAENAENVTLTNDKPAKKKRVPAFLQNVAASNLTSFESSRHELFTFWLGLVCVFVVAIK
jgi:hypothetical protein